MVKFLDIGKINDQYEPELSEAILRVVRSGYYLLGNEVRNFEEELKQFIGVDYCVCVGSGLDALRLILRSYIELGQMQPGDEIIVPSHTFIASILAITDNGLCPVFVEPDPVTYNIDPDRIEEKISNRTKGIMIVHLYGQNAMHPKIEALKKKYALKIIEDAAQAIGCKYQDRMIGALGDAAGHSFYPGKNLGALGDGGAITTSDAELAEVARALANYGSHKKYVNKYQGINSRLNEIQAAILSVKLKGLQNDNEKRREVAQEYSKHIYNPLFSLPKLANEDKATGFQGHVWHLYVITTDRREEFMQYMSTREIQTLIHYPIPPHQQESYAKYRHLSLPITEKLHRTVVSIPISPVMESLEVKQVVEALNGFR